ncbi:MAG: hypothetical protein ACREA0_34175, partial [bacterium]
PRKIDLSSPEATITAYCRAPDVSTAKQVFYPALNLQEQKRFEKPIWTDCTIVEVRETKEIGRYLGDIEGRPGFSAQPGDVEVVKEVKMIDPSKGNPKTRFWYLLRNFNGEWKIIAHYHIPDANYPPLD